MEKKYTLTGKIVSGARKAAFFTQLAWVQEQCASKLEFMPFPGTLNLEIDKPFIGVVKSLQAQNGIALLSPDPKFCDARTLPVDIGGIRGAIIIPAEDVHIHAKNILEIIAPVCLKKALKLSDGDFVTIEVALPSFQ